MEAATSVAVVTVAGGREVVAMGAVGLAPVVTG
jgi:hypothetical protein